MAVPTGQIAFATGSLASSTVTADQVIVSRKISPGKQFVIQYAEANVQLTTFAGTATAFGTVSLECPAGNKLLTFNCAGPQGTLNSPVYLELPEPLVIQGDSDGSKVVRWVCTPAAATPFTWEGNIVGYER